LGWSSDQIHFLRIGCILHDVGKINISETVLNKKGPLTESEWEEMKRHPASGADLVKDIHYLAPAIPVILYHHERWNGKGYPQGLAGEDIPLPARIIAVADSFDAMTTLRPYRAVLTPEQSRQEILSGSGSQYDPAVVEAFLRAWSAGRIEQIFGQFP
jgi:HD-GYP domain-containing protein (c-di-GMP phosphodiesterase class II)